MLFGSYRRGDANDPDAYVASIAAVLSVYEPDLMREVTDPRTGIMTTEKYMTFMPNAGELKVYCDAVQAKRARYQKMAALPKPNFQRLPAPPQQPGDLANLFVPSTDMRYPRIIEWAKTADERLWRVEDGRDGIFIALSAWETGAAFIKQIGTALPANVAAA